MLVFKNFLNRRLIKNEPASYQIWLSQPLNKAQVHRYKSFLKEHHLESIVPEFELLQTARDWKNCNASEYEIRDCSKFCVST